MSFSTEPLGLRVLTVVAPAMMVIGALSKWRFDRSLSLREMAMYVGLGIAYEYVFVFGCGPYLIGCASLLSLTVLMLVFAISDRNKKHVSPHVRDSGETRR